MSELFAPTPPLAVADAWEALADGLHVQRLVLHLSQWRTVVDAPDASGALFAQVSPLVLAARPTPAPKPQAADLIGDAGLAAWVELPQRYGSTPGLLSPLAGVAAEVADTLLEGVAADQCTDAVSAVCAASAWWVGVFATIRHLGVHHLTLEAVTDDIGLEVLAAATRVVALGAATRLLRHRVRSSVAGADDVVSLAYCRAITEGIIAESRMPQLLSELGELRLVDLVATSIPWRGRFTKYAGGTGAGQVE